MIPFLVSQIESAPLNSGVYKQLQASIYDDFFAYFIPETVLLITILVMLMLAITKFGQRDTSRRWYHMIAAGSLIVSSLIFVFTQERLGAGLFTDFGDLGSLALPDSDTMRTQGAGSMIAADGLSQFFRFFLLLCGLITVWMGVAAKEMRDRSLPEFYSLLLGSLVGMMLLSGANHMLLVYLAIEMMSLPSYVMVALRRNQKRATEASLKYMLFGSVASGGMVYGLSLIYGFAGGLSFHEIANGLSQSGEALGISMALFLFVIGLGYKMAIAPMHFWCPDAYEGAPTPVTAFLSVASKAAGFAVALRVIYLLSGANLPGAESLPWIEVLAALSVLTMSVGNFAAIQQTNIKRMLAYSSIAHAGYMLMGITAVAYGQQYNIPSVATAGLVATAVYMLAYMVTNFGAFGAVIALENQDNDDERIEAFRGLLKRNVFMAICVFVILLSLLGVPPTFGFWGKFLLFKAAVEGAEGNPAIVVMLIAAAINTAVSAYYYFKIAREMFLVDVEEGSVRPFFLPTATRSLIGLSAAGIIICFIMYGVIGEDVEKRFSTIGGEASVTQGADAYTFDLTAKDAQDEEDSDEDSADEDGDADESAEANAESDDSGDVHANLPSDSSDGSNKALTRE